MTHHADPNDYMLERLAAGDLSPEQSARLLASLEDQPERRAKLDALIAHHEAFLEELPPQLMVPRILRRAQEDARASSAADRRQRRPSAPQLAWASMGALACAALALVTLGWPSSTRQALPDEPSARQRATAQEVASPSASPLEPDPAPSQASPAASPSAAPGPWPALDQQAELIFQVGESRTFDLKGVKRFSIEAASILIPTDAHEAVQDKTKVTLAALSPGLTTLDIHTARGRQLRYARVSPATPPEAVQQAQRAGLPGECTRSLSGVTITLRLVVNHRGEVLQAQIDEPHPLTLSAQTCITEAAHRWSLPVPKLSGTTVAVLSMTL